MSDALPTDPVTYRFWEHVWCVVTFRHWGDCLTTDKKQCIWCGVKVKR